MLHVQLHQSLQTWLKEDDYPQGFLAVLGVEMYFSPYVTYGWSTWSTRFIKVAAPLRLVRI